MKILVFSDSHGMRGFMRLAISATHPDAVVHLGDYFDDAEILSEEFKRIPFHMVPGNCDRNRMLCLPPQTLCYDVCGVKLFMTHGHLQQVKTDLQRLIRQGEENCAQAILYGHTHCADCRQLDSGIWMLNPGSCGSYGGSVAIIETDEHEIVSCRILRQENLEVLK